MLAFTPGNASRQCIWCHRDVSSNLVQAASAPGPFHTDIRKLVDSQLCAICHGPVGPGKRFYQSGLTTNENPDGAQLYHHLCASCHRALADSQVEGESAEEIYEAIAENEGGMGPLSALAPHWIQAITLALGGDPTLPPDIPAPGTGAALYQQYCAGCHGGLANSSKAGASASRIQTAIANNTGGMGQLSSLTAAQIQAVADALSGQTPPPGGGGTDGAALYQQNCSGCHGALASSNQAGATVNEIQNAINSNRGGMGQFSFLTSTQIQAIAAALSGQTPPPGGGGTDGATLYQQNCSGCHGALANSNQAGATVNEIQNAINSNRGGMGQLSSLTAAQIQAIAAALSGQTPPPGGGGGGSTDGVVLYQQYCSGCHRTLDNSRVSGESDSDIRDAIRENEGGMGSLSFLSREQIRAIAAALDD
ncbi:MAG TPA: c-type cytochrome [Gammaproteobacteria bacterium]